MLQKTIITICLLVSVLFTQLAFVQHQSVHFADLNSTQPNDEHTGAKLCDQCVNQAEFEHSLVAISHTLPQNKPTQEQVFTSYHAFFTHVLFKYPVRAPPIFS